MDLLNNLGISYMAGYLIQGNQLERLHTSTALNVKNTMLQVRTDGKDSNIDNIVKKYKDNIVFHLPSINSDLSNLDLVNNVVKKIKQNNLKLVTVNASNLSFDLFDFSTLDEQKKYFLNIVTSIATLASNKIEVAIENMPSNNEESVFGKNMSQITDIIIYSRKMLVNDFGLKEEEAEKYVGLSLNIDNIDVTKKEDNIRNYFEIFNKYIKTVKLSNTEYSNLVYDLMIENNIDVPIFMISKDDLDELKFEYELFRDNTIEYLKDKGLLTEEDKKIKEKKLKKEIDNKGFSNIIVYTMIVLTIVIVSLMFIIKMK